MSTDRLAQADGPIEYELGTDPAVVVPTGFQPGTRVAPAAPVVVTPGHPNEIDGAGTCALRQHFWSSGFHVAQAMDNAQRSTGIA